MLAGLDFRPAQSPMAHPAVPAERVIRHIQHGVHLGDNLLSSGVALKFFNGNDRTGAHNFPQAESG